MKSIVLAGGCFWGVEAYYKRVKGVLATRVGYAQGTKEDPNYKEVCEGNTGHAEVCDVIFDEDYFNNGVSRLFSCLGEIDFRTTAAAQKQRDQPHCKEGDRSS